MTAELRPMRVADLPAVHALEQILYPSDAWTVGQFHDELDHVPDTRHYLVLELDGVVIGYAGLFSPHDGADADITTLSVAPDHQRQGHGQRLLDELLHQARRRRAESVFLEVRVGNEPALALYRKNGFEVLGRRRDYYGPGVDATTMRLVLP